MILGSPCHRKAGDKGIKPLKKEITLKLQAEAQKTSAECLQSL